MTHTVQILLISGSTRHPSHTCTLTERVEEALAKHKAATIHWNLPMMPLPIADPAFHLDPAHHTDETVHTFVAHAASCDAFVLSSPVYHNSYSGVLKNALDHFAIAQFYYKPVGLMSHDENGSTQAVDHLRTVVRGLLGIAIPTQVCTAEQDYFELGGGKGYELNSEKIVQRIERFALELMLLAHQFRLFRQSILE